MKCTKCGTDVAEGNKSCPSCGQDMTEARQTISAAPPLRTVKPPLRVKPLAAQAPKQQPALTARKQRKPLLIAGMAVAAAVICGLAALLFLNRDKDEERDEDTEEASATAYDALQEVAIPAQAPLPASADTSGIRDYSYVCDTWLSDSDVAGMPAQEQRLMRNTVYARHGRKFQSEELQEYFSRFPWYEPRYDDISGYELSETERHNIALIQRYE